MLAHGAQELGIEALLAKEIEDLGRPVVGGRVVGGAGEAGGPVAVRHPVGWRVRQIRELGEPAGDHRAQIAARRDPQEAVALAELHVLVAAAHHPGALEPLVGQRPRDHVERVVGVDQQLRTVTSRHRRQRLQAGHDARVPEQHARDRHQARAVVDAVGEPAGQRVERVGRHLHQLDPLFSQPVELAAQRVELTVGGDDAGPGAQVERGQQPHDKLVSVGPENEVAVAVAQQAPPTLPDALGAGEGALPLPVHQFGGVVPSCPLARFRAVGPRLMGVAGEQQSFSHPEAGVVASERVRRAGKRLQVGEGAHRSVRIAHRSGNRGWNRVRTRYSAPAEPPVPFFVPIVRSTILTCR